MEGRDIGTNVFPGNGFQIYSRRAQLRTACFAAPPMALKKILPHVTSADSWRASAPPMITLGAILSTTLYWHFRADERFAVASKPRAARLTAMNFVYFLGWSLFRLMYATYFHRWRVPVTLERVFVEGRREPSRRTSVSFLDPAAGRLGVASADQLSRARESGLRYPGAIRGWLRLLPWNNPVPRGSRRRRRVRAVCAKPILDWLLAGGATILFPEGEARARRTAILAKRFVQTLGWP